MKRHRRSWFRGLWPVLILFAGALFLRSRSHAEVLPPHKDLDAFPAQIGQWAGTRVTIPADSLAVLGPGHFLERLYQDPGKTSIDLFIAYFPSQSTGDTIHSPKHCLPGAGWTPIESKIIRVPWGDGRVLTANYYVLELGLSKEVVIYWFQSHGRSVANEYWVKFYLVEDALRMNRTDGALVRVITPVGDSETLSSGKQRALNFTKMILPKLSSYIPN
ncbi:MAG: exosortase C-terminal domain/associated protein EpsI [Terriglobia bacterium]